MSQIFFTRNLVKGKIAETIFSQMFRQSGFKVIDFGYERVVPELVGGNYLDDKSDIIETLRTAPDFAVISQSKEVRLIEVKYKRFFDKQRVLENAQRMHGSWNPSWLFLATQDGFYFDEVSDICANGGTMKILDILTIPKDTQDSYLKILKDFEANN